MSTGSSRFAQRRIKRQGRLAPVSGFSVSLDALMNKRVHLILGCWAVSHVGHGVLSMFYEKAPASFLVPIIYAAFIMLAVGTWARNRWSAKMSAIAAVMTIIIQGLFIWKRDAYGSFSIPVLAFDIVGIACSLLYLAFYFSSSRERYLAESRTRLTRQ